MTLTLAAFLGMASSPVAMFEDSFKNLVTAKSLGMRTVFIRSETATDEGVGDSNLETVDAVVDDVSARSAAIIVAT